MARTTDIALLLAFGLAGCPQPSPAPPAKSPADTGSVPTAGTTDTGEDTATSATTTSTGWTPDADWRPPTGWSWTGEEDDRLGGSLAVGDIDGNGGADVVASFGQADGVTDGTHGARWMSGLSAPGPAATAAGGTWTLENIQQVADSFGAQLSVGSGFTGGSLPEVSIGGFGYGAGDDPVSLVYSGPAEGALDPWVSPAFVPWSETDRVVTVTRLIGDVDGDGSEDLLGDGAIYFGPRSGELEAGVDDLVLTGSDSAMGGVVLGDFNADGLDDLAGWVPQPFPGPQTLAAFENLSSGVRDIAAPDLVWTDTDQELVGGAPFRRAGDPVGDGRAYIALYEWSGLSAVLLPPEPYADAGAWASFTPRYADDWAGPTAFGDFDGDGQQDWLVGIQRGSEAPPRVALLPGPIAAGAYTEDDARSVTLLVDGPPGGPDLAGDIDVGDLDGDGMDDAVIGDPTNADGGEAAGAILVLPGSELQ